MSSRLRQRRARLGVTGDPLADPLVGSSTDPLDDVPLAGAGDGGGGGGDVLMRRMPTSKPSSKPRTSGFGGLSRRQIDRRKKKEKERATSSSSRSSSSLKKGSGDSTDKALIKSSADTPTTNTKTAVGTVYPSLQSLLNLGIVTGTGGQADITEKLTSINTGFAISPLITGALVLWIVGTAYWAHTVFMARFATITHCQAEFVALSSGTPCFYCTFSESTQTLLLDDFFAPEQLFTREAFTALGQDGAKMLRPVDYNPSTSDLRTHHFSLTADDVVSDVTTVAGSLDVERVFSQSSNPLYRPGDTCFLSDFQTVPVTTLASDIQEGFSISIYYPYSSYQNIRSCSSFIADQVQFGLCGRYIQTVPGSPKWCVADDDDPLPEEDFTFCCTWDVVPGLNNYVCSNQIRDPNTPTPDPGYYTESMMIGEYTVIEGDNSVVPPGEAPPPTEFSYFNVVPFMSQYNSAQAAVNLYVSFTGSQLGMQTRFVVP